MNAETNIQKTQESYDELPYPSKAFSNTLPDRQKTILKLFGFNTPALETARVLEIGCSYGGNILSFALANPKAEVVGIDLSEYQIKEGQKLIEQIGLKNIKLYHKNVMDFDESFGKFDYIVCHGVFSWVPENVQDKILEVIHNHLADNGSAVISYNTYPGWKKIEVLKDIMLLRIKMLNQHGIEIGIKDKVSYGKGALEFLEEHSFLPEDLKDYAKTIRNKDSYYIYHEYYEENNNPMYLYDFNEKLKKFDLCHIADSSLQTTFPSFGNTEAEEILNKECGNDTIQKEQYYDFMKNTQFRRSIITHKHNREKINVSKDLSIKHIESLYIFLKDNTVTSNDEFTQNILDNLKKEFPHMIQLKDFVEKYYPENERNLAYAKVISNIIYDNTIFATTQKRTIVHEDKLHVNECYRKIINYVVNTQHPIVKLANFQGFIMELSNLEGQVFQLLDGTRTDDEIVEIVLDNLDKNLSAEQLAEQQQKA